MNAAGTGIACKSKNTKTHELAFHGVLGVDLRAAARTVGLSGSSGRNMGARAHPQEHQAVQKKGVIGSSKGSGECIEHAADQARHLSPFGLFTPANPPRLYKERQVRGSAVPVGRPSRTAPGGGRWSSSAEAACPTPKPPQGRVSRGTDSRVRSPS